MPRTHAGGWGGLRLSSLSVEGAARESEAARCCDENLPGSGQKMYRKTLGRLRNVTSGRLFSIYCLYLNQYSQQTAAAAHFGPRASTNDNSRSLFPGTGRLASHTPHTHAHEHAYMFGGDRPGNWGCKWEVGDVIALAAIVDQGKVTASKNSSWYTEACGVVIGD